MTDANGPTDSSTDTETIEIGECGETLPVVELLTGRGFVTGKSGSGKSNSMSVIAEALLDKGFPLLAVDTDGEYWGLKEEYEILHVGADEECDIQVSADHGEKIASLALEENVPIILDLSGFLKDADANELLVEVARHLFAKAKKLKQPFLMLVEEIHEYVPEGGGIPKVGQMLVKIAKRGRKHGLGIAGISQRPADVKKDFITQCDWLVWHRLTWQNDTKVVRRILGSEYADEIESMADGEAFVQTDWDDGIRQMQWRRKRTFDAGATPGLDDFERPDLKSVSDDLVDELEDITEAKQRREGELAQKDRRIEDLEATVEELQEELQQAREMEGMAEQFADAMLAATDDDGTGEATIKAEVAEIREEKNDHIAELEAELNAREERIADLEATVEELRPKAERADRLADVDLDVADEALTRLGEALGRDVDGLGASKEQAYREEISQLQSRIEELDGGSESLIPDETVALLDHDAVQNRIDTAYEDSDRAEKHFEDAVNLLADGEWKALEDDLLPYMDTSETTVRQVVNRLVDHGVLKRDGSQYALHTEGLRECVEVAERQRELKDRRGA